jgi:hypothetical protein
MADHYLFHRRDIPMLATFQAPCFALAEETASSFRGKALGIGLPQLEQLLPAGASPLLGNPRVAWLVWPKAVLVGEPTLFHPVPVRNRYAEANRAGGRIVFNENNLSRGHGLTGGLLSP